MIKFLQNGIKSDDDYVSVFYSIANNTRHSDKCIVVYARNYASLPKELGNIENDTDIMTDYFDEDKCYIEPDNKFYAAAFAAYKKAEIASQKRRIAYNEKRLAKLHSFDTYSIEYCKDEIKYAKEQIAKLSA